MTKEIKQAFESAEQEIQEKEIANLKSIIKELLEKKVEKEKDKREIEKEISVIKQTIDDFKAGRLDKIKEMQEKDSVAKSILPFKVVIINQPIITQPWGWHYQVVPDYSPLIVSSGNGWGGTTITGISSSNSTNGSYIQASLTGSSYGSFTTGAYNLGSGATVNLN